MAELEALLYQQVPVDFNRLEVQYKRFSAAVERGIRKGATSPPTAVANITTSSGLCMKKRWRPCFSSAISGCAGLAAPEN
jgi:hypothetical protein